MSRSKIYKRCSLCYYLDEPNGENLTSIDSLQLCPECYARYTKSAYNQRIMLLNSIKCYRKLIEKYENSSNVNLETRFIGIV